MYLTIAFVSLILYPTCALFIEQDLEVQQTLPILNAYLTILKSYLEHLKLPINEGELMIRFVAPAFNMSLDPNQEKFRKHW